MNSIRHLESAAQQTIFEWANLKFIRDKYPELEMLHAIPNGGARNKATAAILKAEGVKAGVSDIHLPVPRGGYASLYIELKSTEAQNKKGTKEQREWIDLCNIYGNYALICIGTDEAINTIEKYLKGELNK